ncbi:hypothetical protein [Desulfobacterium sp. N47]|uniref:Uncharacterized protein n=1 Tax=uncultured Desulfobacterium sp. TaxID=201089 RepID=E1YHA0_9BACT|nr:unknown protein [uncultured Desulfobacterium sp.]
MKPWIVAIILTIAVAYFIYRVTYLIKLLKLGKPENRYDRVGERLWITIKQSILQFSQFRVPKGDYTYAGMDASDQCPANSTGKVLSPREIILSLKENLFANAEKLLSTPKDQWREMERVEL